ncbi:RNA polymerase sigma factor [Planctomycetota bacterium]
MIESDHDCIEQCLNGHPDEFRYLVRRYQTALLTYLTGLLGNGCDAEEVAQEAFVRAYFGLSTLKKRGSFYAWLVGIAQRVAREQGRDRKRQTEMNRLVNRNSKEFDEELEKAMAKLPEPFRELIHRRFYVDQSCAQIAEHLDIPIGTVTKKLSRAYAKLRRFLSNHREVQP